MITQEDLKKIKLLLADGGVKDSSFPTVTSFNGLEKVVILQNGKNKLISLNQLAGQTQNIDITNYIDVELPELVPNSIAVIEYATNKLNEEKSDYIEEGDLKLATCEAVMEFVEEQVGLYPKLEVEATLLGSNIITANKAMASSPFIFNTNASLCLDVTFRDPKNAANHLVIPGASVKYSVSYEGYNSTLASNTYIVNIPILGKDSIYGKRELIPLLNLLFPRELIDSLSITEDDLKLINLDIEVSLTYHETDHFVVKKSIPMLVKSTIGGSTPNVD